MSFVFPLFLGGAVFLAVPVLVHLIMRQKPKHLFFPAFRFLLQRHRTNQRKLRLRHLLLLALRMLLIAAICLALARPKVFSERINLGGDRPVAVVLVFDTSLSMEYASAGRSRLDEAKRRAAELLAEIPDGSRVAVLDTAEPIGEWLPTLSLARERIAELKLRPNNSPVTSRLGEAYRLLGDPEVDAEGTQEPLPRFLYVFSDRTPQSWEHSRSKDLQQARDRLTQPVHGVYIDVGVEQPVDVALLSPYLPRQVVPVHDKVVLQVTVHATGAPCDTEVLCRIDKEDIADKKPVKLEAGQSSVLTFERAGLKLGPHQAEVTLATADALPFNNALFATFEVRGSRRVLILVDDLREAEFLKLALQDSWKETPSRGFQCDVLRVSEAGALGPEELSSKYQAICLLSVAKPSSDLWERLLVYVEKGGGLAVMPGGQELDKEAYNTDSFARRLLPGQLVQVIKAAAEPGVRWNENTYQHHALVTTFKLWKTTYDVDFEKVPADADRYWEVTPYASDAYVIVKYADPKGRPALLERNFDRNKVRGRVLLYTTPLDKRHLVYGDSPGKQRPWNDYLTDWFYPVLVNETVGYLAGDAEDANLNHLSGQTVRVSLPAASHSPTYNLEGPGLSTSESTVVRLEGQSELALRQAVTPGNYRLHEGDKILANFSVNVPPEESQLEPRVPPEQIEELLGPKALLAVGHGSNLREALQGRFNQPLELFPWLMIGILLVLAVENLLANKFYRREPSETDETPTPATAEEAK